ncbi:hypothetical protein EW026_g5565 [Hermanssonia centrifuga]|uniref:TPR-like protein n=1 Tax=Hermanssonia centrifuga TaxID=98765 RepID=A0A4S4KFH3_9APHY|nr:hypothetical protein EW026_g5565 [Hermanssonia centrifuga]
MEAPDQDIKTKMGIAKQKKEAGDQAFKAGEVQNALRGYHEAVLYLTGLTKNMPQGVPGSGIDQATEKKPKTEAEEMLEKIYANMCACHIKRSNWKRAVETADKASAVIANALRSLRPFSARQALAKNENNPKVLFRKAKALGEQGYFEKAEKILEDLKIKDEADIPTIDAELTRLRAMDKEREKVHNKKFKGFLNREKGSKAEQD